MVQSRISILINATASPLPTAIILRHRVCEHFKLLLGTKVGHRQAWLLLELCGEAGSLVQEVDRVVARLRSRENEQHDTLAPVHAFVTSHMQVCWRCTCACSISVLTNSVLQDAICDT